MSQVITENFLPRCLIYKSDKDTIYSTERLLPKFTLIDRQSKRNLVYLRNDPIQLNAQLPFICPDFE